MSTGYQKRAKKILYLLYKKTNRELWEFRGGKGSKLDHANLEILRRFKKKGLVDMAEYSTGNIYYLTDEGDKVAKPIAAMVDEFKEW